MVLIARANGLGRARFGVVASRKVGPAVVRNRCKRLLREAARDLIKSGDHCGIDLLLIARPPCRGVRMCAVQAEAQSLCAVAVGRISRPNPPEGSAGP